MTTTVAGRARPGDKFDRHQIVARADAFLVGWRLFAVVGAIYLAYALFVTWPLASNISGLLSAPGFQEDGAGTASYFAYLVAHHMSPFLPGNMSGLNAPYGMKVTWALNLAQAPSYLLYWLSVLAFGPVAGGNLFMLVGFVGSGTTMFAFTRRLFGSRIVALLAGFAFAFYPFAVSASSVHYVFVHGWPLVLCVWRLVEMIHEPNRRNALLAGVATAFAMWWNPYYELLGGFAFATCLVVCVGCGRSRAAFRAAATACIPVAALGIFLLALLRVGGGLSDVGTVARPLSQVYAFSAHLREYFLPGPFNPLFGHLTGPFLAARLGISDTWDSAIYPGYIVMALALMGFVTTVRALRSNHGTLTDIRVVSVLTAAGLATVAFISSLPPYTDLGGIRVTLLSGLLYGITPTWQTFSRFVILLELALILMMAAELARIRSSLTVRKVAVVFTVVGLLLAVDLWASPPTHTVSTAPPPAYAWLRAHPGGIVASYPILPAYDPASASALYWGAFDGHPLFQGYSALTPIESLKLDLADLNNRQTAAKLASYGVRYIVVQHDSPGGEPSSLRKLGYQPILISRSGSLWRVIASPAKTAIDALSGFDWDAGFPRYDLRLLLGTGSLKLSARNCRVCTGTAVFRIGGQRKAFTLIVNDGASGSTLTRISVPAAGSVLVRVPDIRLIDGNARLELRTIPETHAVYVAGTARLVLGNK